MALASTGAFNATLANEPKSSAQLQAIDTLEQAFEALPSLTEQSRAGLRNLHAYKAEEPTLEYPKGKLAGVLVLLHVDRNGQIVVTLTTRSLALRSHPGETALPGGRYEDGDETIEQTALREANEEVALPLEPSTLFHLTNLPAFTSRTYLVVIPVVYLLVVPDPSAYLAAHLVPSPSEVSSIFHVPIEPFLLLDVDGNSNPERYKHDYQDVAWPLLDSLYRLHWFEHPSFASLVSGLTADILVYVAMIAKYGPDADGDDKVAAVGFERNAQGQLSWKDCVAVALDMHSKRVKVPR